MKLLSSKKELNDVLIGIIEQSVNELIIISPYIGLDFYYCREGDKWYNMLKILRNKKNIIEIYTNPNNIEEEDLTDYVTEEGIVGENNIIPVNNLHAKIYINDTTALLSSMNLLRGSFNRSIDFGIVTENPEERKEVIEYCKKNILIHNKKPILDYFSKENMNVENVEFEMDRNCLAKFNQRVNYLKLIKGEGTYIRCNIDEYDTYPDKIYFYFEIVKNSKQLKNGEINIAGIKWSEKMEKHYISLQHYLPLPKSKDDRALLIPAINSSGNKILEILTEIYNSI